MTFRTKVSIVNDAALHVWFDILASTEDLDYPAHIHLPGKDQPFMKLVTPQEWPLYMEHPTRRFEEMIKAGKWMMNPNQFVRNKI